MRKMLLLSLCSTLGWLSPAAAGDPSVAVAQLDALCVQGEEHNLRWLRFSADMECRLNGPVACAERLVGYLDSHHPSPTLAAFINDALTRVSRHPEAHPTLTRAHRRGLLDARYQLAVNAGAGETTIYRIPDTLPAAPDYPDEALAQGRSGHVLLGMAIGTDGRVSGMHILESSPEGVFEDAAVRWAAAERRYPPRRIDGRPVPSASRVLLRFSADGTGAGDMRVRPPKADPCVRMRAAS